MRQLTKPSTPPEFIEHLKNIRDAKKSTKEQKDEGTDAKSILTTAHDEITKAYRSMDNALQHRSLHTLIPSKDLSLIADVLVGCYSGKTKGINAIKNLIRISQEKRFLKYCPMCGTTLPRTYDHYLPSSRFPEYSVHPINLIPCCAICNSTKDDDWLDAAGNRQYMHLYTDEWPVEKFLEVALVEIDGLEGVGAHFKISCPANFKGNWKLIEAHYTRLKLLERYIEQGNDEIDEILADCAIHLKSGGEKVGDFLLLQAKDREHVYGTNHWRVQLMLELAKSQNLDKWVAIHMHKLEQIL